VRLPVRLRLHVAEGGNLGLVNLNIGGSAHVDDIDFFDLNTTHVGFTRVTPRAGCFYKFITQPFKCPATAFAASVSAEPAAIRSSRGRLGERPRRGGPAVHARA